jgi:hypothetical protein
MINTVQDDYSIVLGSLAFLFTVAHVLTVFPIYFSLTVQNQVPKKKLLLWSFSIGCVAHTWWLIYAWPTGDLFLKIAIALWVVAYVVFIVQLTIIGK